MTLEIVSPLAGVKMTKVDKIVSEIEGMPIEKRTQIIDRLLHGIMPINKEIDELWAIEAEKRISEMDNSYHSD